jgi:hypothetical protein
MIEYRLQQGNQDMLEGNSRTVMLAVVRTVSGILRSNQGKTDYDLKEFKKTKTSMTQACSKFKDYIRPFIDMVKDTNDTSKYRILYNLSLKLIE